MRHPHTHALARWIPIFICILLCATLFFGCGSTAGGLPSYMDEDFSATLTGSRGGLDFSCVVRCRGGEPIFLRYEAPEALCGVTLERLEDGSWQARCGEVNDSVEAAMLSGLLAPAWAILPENATVRSVQRLSVGVQFSLDSSSFSTPITLTVDRAGMPTVATVGDLSLRVEEVF